MSIGLVSCCCFTKGLILTQKLLIACFPCFFVVYWLFQTAFELLEQQTMRYTFCQQERLKSRKQIAALFKNRRSVGAYPLRIFWGDRPHLANSYPVSIGFNVSKRLFKHAVDRNRYRRLLQEAFRLQKQELYEFLEQEGKELNLMLIFVGKDGADYATVERQFKKLMGKLMDEIKTV